ncbi:MAG TPA: hypothetical protein VES39_07375 [Rhodospirillales bacterium]|nr:hypothetical protein [Rhodospirillales bacterium]
MKIDILFALPGSRNPVGAGKLLVIAAATEHEDPAQLAAILAEVAESAIPSGAYSAIQKVTLDLDESVVLAMLQDGPTPAAIAPTPVRLDRRTLH